MSDEQLQPDPIDLLRRANPVSRGSLPPGSDARLRARVMEDTMTDTDPIERDHRAPRSGILRPILYGAGAIALVVAVVLGTGVLGPKGAGPGALSTPTDSPVTPGGALASCVTLYDLETLGDRGWAFDGTVTAINGDSVTFTINRAFKGVDGATVTRNANGMTGGVVTSASDLTLEVGQRYLVAGEDEFVWGCGFTQPYDQAVAADWARVFGG